jgi:O-antigen/teichoic acid export membrane protein/peptidoglycan/xylan/chitin deacetylase (PgdA/CDA1 family)
MPESPPDTNERTVAEGLDGSLAASRRIGRNTVVRSAGELVAKAATLVFFVLVARELGTSAFGDFTFALSLVTILMLSAGFGTDSLIAREVGRDASRVHQYLTNVVAIKLLASALLVAVGVGVAALEGESSTTLIVVLILGLGVAVETLGQSWHAVLQAYERMEFISAALVFQRLLTTVVGIAVLAAGGEIVAVSLVYLGGAVAGLAFATWVNRRFVVAPQIVLDRSQWLPMLRLAAPIGVATLLYTLLLKVDATLIGFLAGEDDNSQVGLYGAAFRLVEGTMFLSWAFGAAALPWLARRGVDERESLSRAFQLGLKATAVVLTPIGLAFVLLAPELIDLLYGPAYEGAVVPLRVLGMITVLYGLNFFTSTLLTARDRPGRFTVAVAAVAVQNVVQNLILIPPHGAVGAAATAATSGVLLAVISVWQTRSVTGSIRVVRVFAATLAGAGAMAAGILLTGLPLVPALLVGGLLYVVVVIIVERFASPGDFELLASALRRRARVPRGPGRAESAAARRGRGPRPLVLAYHGLDRVPREHDPANLMVPPETFAGQVQSLRRRGYEFVTVAQFAARMAAGEPLRGLCALTFDDGSRDNATVLPALLDRLEVAATVYVCPGLLGRPHPYLAPAAGIEIMTRDELVELSRHPRVELGAHTNTHADLGAASHDEALREMAECREELEGIIGSRVASFAYPFCRYSPACREAARSAGFASAVTCGERGGWLPYELRRESIGPLDGRVAFALKARGAYYPLWRSAPGRLARWIARPWRHPDR